MIFKFFILMGLSSSLTLVRGFVVASLVSLDEFGIFVVIVAVGIFSSNILGLGQIEGTMKTFPRAWNLGFRRQICVESDVLSRKIIVRALVAIIIASIFFYSTGNVERLEMIGMVAGVSIGAAMMGIYSSMLRASGNLKQLGQSTFARSFLALIFCSTGAFMFGWHGAVIGEFIAAFLGALHARHAGRCLINSEGVLDKKIEHTKFVFSQSSSGGEWLLLATLATSIPFYLDRLFVATFFGISVAGQYGFLMLLVTGASTFAGVLVQKVGPELVKGAQMNVGLYFQYKVAVRWMCLHTIFIIFGVGVFGVLTLIGPLNFLGERYELSISLILVTLMLASMQCSVIFDWILISLNQERLVFFTGAIYFCLISIFAMLLIFSKFNATLIELIACIAIAKFAQLLSQYLLIVARIRVEKIEN